MTYGELSNFTYGELKNFRYGELSMSKIELLAKSDKGELKLPQEIQDKLMILCGMLPSEHRKSKFQTVAEAASSINSIYDFIKNSVDIAIRIELLRRLFECADFILDYLSKLS